MVDSGCGGVSAEETLGCMAVRERKEEGEGRMEPRWYEYLDGCVLDSLTYATCMRGNKDDIGPEIYDPLTSV